MSELVTERKGPTAPAQRVPGQLRYALGLHTFLLNFAHSPDDTADLLRELTILLDEADAGRLLATITGPSGEPKGSMAPAEVRAVVDSLHARTPARSLDPQDALAVLAADPACRALGCEDVVSAVTAVGGLGRDNAVDEQCAALLQLIRGQDILVDPWSLVVLGSYVLPMSITGAAPDGAAPDGAAR